MEHIIKSHEIKVLQPTEQTILCLQIKSVTADGSAFVMQIEAEGGNIDFGSFTFHDNNSKEYKGCEFTESGYCSVRDVISCALGSSTRSSLWLGFSVWQVIHKLYEKAGIKPPYGPTLAAYYNSFFNQIRDQKK